MANRDIDKKEDKLKFWQDKLVIAKTKYDDVINTIDDNVKAYKGTRNITKPDGTPSDNKITTVRKVIFELIESQVDTNIPMPKVTSLTGNHKRAEIIEHYLKNEMDNQNMVEINDEQSRTTPIAGGSIFYVEWDNTIKTRNSIGKLKISNLDPTQVIPQPGVYKLQDMDYIFLTFLQSKQEIKLRYDVDVETMVNDNVELDNSNNDELLTHNLVYYKDEKGRIGLFSWVNDTVIQDLDDYFARKQYVCTKCDEIKDPDSDECTKCGNTSFKLENLDNNIVTIPQMSINPETGEQIETEVEIEVPHFVPRLFPFVIRKNVSQTDSFLGGSDVSAIKDQQNELNIITNKIREKLLKGGSLVTVPEGVKLKATNEEMKIVTVKNPQQASLIDVKNMQANVNNDLAYFNQNYEIARQTIGITDSYQGRKDTTATSGKAKQFAAQQTQGRLDSKRAMKENAFVQLYELCFQFILAYADDPIYYVYQDQSGETLSGMFDKRMFIERTEDGQYFYDSEFTFTTDPSASLSKNRQAMWEETRLNFTSGSFGNPQDLDTIAMFWQMMDKLQYPGASQALQFVTIRIENAKEQAAQQQQQMVEQQRMLADQKNTELSIKARDVENRKPIEEKDTRLNQVIDSTMMAMN